MAAAPSATVYVINSEGGQELLVGYAPTVDQAIVLASSAFQVKQGFKPETDYAIGVFDSAGMVAAIGDIAGIVAPA